MKRAFVCAAVSTALASALMVGVALQPADAARRPLPERLTNIASSRQVVVVTSKSWTSSYARLQTWRRTPAGTWVRVMQPVSARVGWNGMRRAAHRIQNSGTTPAGTFRLLRGFGIAKPSAVKLPYQRVDRNDWWPYDPQDPKTYNVFQPHRVHRAKWRTDWAEHLQSYRRQYHYAVVLDYNLPSGIHWRNGQRVASNPANTSAGGGIFLHVNGSGATAGCVSIGKHRMKRVLKWLDPSKQPRIVIGPRDVITKM